MSKQGFDAAADRRSWRDFIPALALLVASTGGIFIAAFSPPGGTTQYAVVAPPWYDRARTFALVGAAGGDIVDVGGLANIAIVHSASPRFIANLYHSGAWLVINPLRLRGCLGFKPPHSFKSGDV